MISHLTFYNTYGKLYYEVNLSIGPLLLSYTAMLLHLRRYQVDVYLFSRVQYAKCFQSVNHKHVEVEV